MAQDKAQIARLKELTERILPALAREQRWPIRLDHCFKRICFDYAFGDLWTRHLPRPAEKHLEAEALARALACAEALATGDSDLLKEHNTASLTYRGKLPKTR